MDFTKEDGKDGNGLYLTGWDLHIYVFNNGVCGLGEHRALRYLQIFIRI